MKGGDLYEKTTAGTVSDPGDALGHHRPGLRPCDAPLSLLVGPPHLAGLSSAETEVRILSRQPPSFGPEKLA